MTFSIGKLEWCGYPLVKKIEDTFIHFDSIDERDRQTYTARRHRLRLCIASRGKNQAQAETVET